MGIRPAMEEETEAAVAVSIWRAVLQKTGR